MSLAEQIQRVDGSQNDILKAFLAAFGVTVGSNKIDQLAALAKAAPLLKENGILAEGTKTSFGLSADSTVDDVLKKLSKAALVGEGGGLLTPGGSVVPQLKVESGSYTGKGKNGENNKNSLSFSGEPLFLMIYNELGLRPGSTYGTGWANSLVWAPNTTKQYTYGSDVADIYKDGSTIYWYSDDSSSGQLNEPNKKYYYIAIVSIGG